MLFGVVVLAAQKDAFDAECRRWNLQESVCLARWRRWRGMQLREAARSLESSSALRVRGHGFVEPSSVDPINDDGCSSVVALGIASAVDHTLARNAMRQTWLQSSVASRFFVALPESGVLPGTVVHEMTTHRDVAVLNFTDTYKATVYKVVAIFRWGVRRCGAWYVARANDDVYLRLGPTLNLLYQVPPSRVYAGRFLTGMPVPRADGLRLPPGANEEEWRAAIKAWTVERRDYPADVYPTFAQGNAYVLSRDLADAVGSLVDKPWIRLTLPDDVLTGLVVDAATAGNPVRIDVPADYELEGKWTSCTDTALWHFNIHFEHMYDLAHDGLSLDVELDHATLALHADHPDNVTVAAAAFVAAHGPIAGAGCPRGDDPCLVGRLASSLLSSGHPRSPPCSRIPDRTFCCG